MQCMGIGAVGDVIAGLLVEGLGLLVVFGLHGRVALLHGLATALDVIHAPGPFLLRGAVHRGAGTARSQANGRPEDHRADQQGGNGIRKGRFDH